MRSIRTWVLVADGSRARILRDPFSHAVRAENLGELVFRAEQKRLREIMADKPGKGFGASGSRRSSMEYHSDPIREDERAFASMLVEVLNSHRIAGDFERLAIFASPEMLGDLRKALPDPLKNITVGEIAKDLTRLPAPELRLAVGALLERGRASV